MSGIRAATSREVATPGGVVEGRAERGVLSFLGVPYAAPPVGKFRFAAPAPAVPWSGVRDATRFGPPPPQSQLAGGPQVAAHHVANPDEWLTVNVWTPDLSAAGLPVMVWIYGGAYMSGSSANPTYDGAALAREGRVVVVTLNYRLAAEGFMHLQDAPANRGLLDQVAALEWVRDSIAAFGGDPLKVTVFGQSAGAGCLAALLCMPSAEGLIHGAIVQSLPRPYITAALADEVAAEIAAGVGRPPARADLEDVDPMELVAAGDALTRRLPGSAGQFGLLASSPSPYCPVLDGAVLDTNPWQGVAAGSARDVPLIVGHTRDEYRLFLALADQEGGASRAETEDALQRLAPGHGSNAYRLAYPDASEARLFELVHSDWLFRMPTLALARAHARAGGATYLYELAFDVPGRAGTLGSPHGSDVPLIFGTFTGGSAALPYPDSPPPAPAVSLGVTMRTAWARFAHTGNPDWQPFTAVDEATQIFDRSSRVTGYPEQASDHLWRRQSPSTFDLPHA